MMLRTQEAIDFANNQCKELGQEYGACSRIRDEMSERMWDIVNEQSRWQEIKNRLSQVGTLQLLVDLKEEMEKYPHDRARQIVCQQYIDMFYAKDDDDLMKGGM